MDLMRKAVDCLGWLVVNGAFEGLFLKVKMLGSIAVCTLI